MSCLRPTKVVARRENSRNASMSFEQLLDHLDPNPEFLPSPWKKAFDRCAKTALIYQLDLLSSVPRIRKAVRVNCKEEMEGCILVPSVFINDQPLEPTFVKNVTGNQYVTKLGDLSMLLEQLEKENHREYVPVAIDHRHSSMQSGLVQQFEFGDTSGLPPSESDHHESLHEDFPLYNSEFGFEVDDTSSPQLFDDGGGTESDDDQESEPKVARNVASNASRDAESHATVREPKAKKQKAVSSSLHVNAMGPPRPTTSARSIADEFSAAALMRNSPNGIRGPPRLNPGTFSRPVLPEISEDYKYPWELDGEAKVLLVHNTPTKIFILEIWYDHLLGGECKRECDTKYLRTLLTKLFTDELSVLALFVRALRMKQDGEHRIGLSVLVGEGFVDAVKGFLLKQGRPIEGNWIRKTLTQWKDDKFNILNKRYFPDA